MLIFNISFSGKPQPIGEFPNPLRRILTFLQLPMHSLRRKLIPYICGLGASVGYERVERVFNTPRLKSQI